MVNERGSLDPYRPRKAWKFLHSPVRGEKGGGMKRLTNNVAAGALVYALLGGATVWGQQPTDTTPSAGKTTPAAASKEAPAAAAKVNLNTADQATLVSVKGIGKKRAQAIIEYREKNGPFKTVDDLTKVKGIGDKQLAQLKDQVTVE
jgi:competence protein ComEA